MADAEKILTGQLRKIAEEQQFKNYTFKITPISSGGGNFTSNLFFATISGDKKDDLELFAKVATPSEQLHNSHPLKMYDIERIAYTELLKIYVELEETHNVPQEHRILIPKLYAYDPTWLHETIVLENMGSSDYETLNRFKTIDWPYAEAAVSQLAKFHALSIAVEEEKPEQFKEVTAVMKFNWECFEVVFDNVWRVMIASGIEVTKEENREKLQKFADQLDTQKYASYMTPSKRAVISHGDYRTSNLMHRYKADGSIEMAVLDFQTFHSSSPVLDLIYFIVISTDKKFRDKYYNQLVDHYYTELSAALRRLHLDPDQIYTKKDYETELKEKLPCGLSLALFTLPINMMDTTDVPDINEDMAMSQLAKKKTAGDLFEERLNDIVDDFVKWGVLV